MGICNNIWRPVVGLLNDSGDQPQKLLDEILLDEVRGFEDIDAAMNDGSRKVAMFENGFLPPIFHAFDCVPFCLEIYATMIAGADVQTVYDFLAAAKEEGLPSDICSTDRFIFGAALRGELPDNAFFVSSTSPCDGTRIVYPMMEKLLKRPYCFVEAPYTYGKEAAGFYAKQIENRLIPFLEEVTKKRFDIDRFREAIEESNRCYQLLTDIHETQMAKPVPHQFGLRQLLLQAFMERGGDPRLTRILQEIRDDAVRRIRQGQPESPHPEKHRVLWLHAPPVYDYELWDWMEREFGACVFNASNRADPAGPIDTTSLDTMLEGYAWQSLDIIMSVIRIDSEYLIQGTLAYYQIFKCDCVFLTQHVGCNSICGLAGVLREELRRHDIPFLFLERGASG